MAKRWQYSHQAKVEKDLDAWHLLMLAKVTVKGSIRLYMHAKIK